MKFPEPISVRQIAEWLDARLIGNDELELTGINEIHKVEQGDITFSDAPKYFQRSIQSDASAVILNAETACPKGKALLIVEDPFQAYDSLVRKYRPFRPLETRIHETANIGNGTVVEEGAIIDREVEIGEDCYIQANAYIGAFTKIGNRVEVQAGAIIGTDAFYFKKYPDRYQKWRSGGHVVLEDDVQIGALCTINRGVSGITRIGAGSKLDCHVHIGHGVVLGKRCLLAGQVGVGGKTVVGDDVTMYGQVGVAQNLTIGSKVTILAASGVGKNLESGKTYFGAPAEEVSKKFRQLAILRQLASRK